MRGQDIVAIVGTFILGLVSGWYLFVFGFSLQFGEVAELVEGETLVVIGEAYGGCERGGYCASFRVADDGSYRAFAGAPDRTQPRVSSEGEIPKDWQRDLRDMLGHEKLEDLSQPYNKTTCRTYNDGIEYRYRIELGEDTYELDTCTTRLATDADTSSLLQDLFLYMEL